MILTEAPWWPLAAALLGLVAWMLERRRKNALEAARALACDLRRLATVVEHTSNAVIELDLGLRVLWVNQGFTRTTGWQPAECIGRSIGELFSHPDGDPSARAALRQAAARGESYRVELLNRRKDGSAVWMDVEIQPTRDEAGRLTGWIEIALDISHRKRVEQVLQQREHLMRLIADNIPARVSYWDADLRCRFVNQAFCHWFGRGREEMLAQTMSAQVFGPDLWRLAAPRIERVLAGEPQQYQVDDCSPSGIASNSQIHYLPDVDSVSGKVCGVFALALDVTELNRARDDAVRASQAKSQFVANMSHELRTPMNAVLGMLQLVQHTPLTEQQSGYLSRAQGAAQALLGILNDILDFSKVEAGKMTLDPRAFDVDTLLGELSVIFSTSVSGKPVEFVYDIHPDLPARLVADDLRLRQVLINLGSNAVKFTERGQVSLAVRPVATAPGQVTVEFAIRDTGIGIAPAHLRRLFQDFGQAEASTTRRFGGTGLGLAICRRLVTLMGGELRVDSTPGEGSCFSFRVTAGVGDVAQARTARVAANPAAAPAQPLAGLRLLVAEDNENNQMVARELLTMQGAQVVIARDGVEAVECVRGEGPFDAVLMDWQMPRMDGLQACAELRTLGFTELPIIAMTANAMASDRATCLAAGMNDHVAKPFMLKDLVARLLQHTGHAPAAPAGGVHEAPPAGAAVAAPMARPLLDRAGALEHLGDCQALYEELLPLFHVDLRKGLELLAREVQPGGDLELATRQAHTLKGTAATVGALRLADAACELEKALKARRGPEQALASLNDVAGQTLAALG